MPGLKWWEDNLKAELSQGDILAALPFAVVAESPWYLAKGQTPKNGPQTIWLPATAPQALSGGGSSMRFVGAEHPAIVISHDCAIDKKLSGRVLVAPLVPRKVYEPGVWQKIVEQKHKSLLPLVGIPELGDHAADLRAISMVPHPVVASATRHASMTTEAVTRLWAQLSVFLFRLDLFPQTPPED